MKELLEGIDGKKRYIGIVAAGVLWIVWQIGFIDDQTASIAAGAIATWTGVAFVHFQNKSKPIIGELVSSDLATVRRSDEGRAYQTGDIVSRDVVGLVEATEAFYETEPVYDAYHNEVGRRITGKKPVQYHDRAGNLIGTRTSPSNPQ